MSRQRGRREPHRRPVRQSDTPQRDRRGLAAAFDGEISGGRKWAAVAAGTFVSVFAFTAIATAIVETGDGNDADARLAVGVAVVLTPVALMAAGFVSRNVRWLRSAALGGALAVAIFVGLGIVLREPLTPTVAALGTGAALSLRFEAGRHRIKWRVGTVALVAVYIGVLWRIAPGLSTVLTPFLPFPAVAVADSITEKRAAGPPAASAAP